MQTRDHIAAAFALVFAGASLFVTDSLAVPPARQESLVTSNRARIEMFIPRVPRVEDAPFYSWILQLNERQSEVFRAWLEACSAAAADQTSKLQTELKPQAEAIAELPRPVTDEQSLETIRTVWKKRNDTVEKMFAREANDLTSRLILIGVSEEDVAPLVDTAVGLRRCLSLAKVSHTVTGARPDVLLLCQTFSEGRKGLSDDTRASLRQFARDAAPRILELRQQAQAFFLRTCSDTYAERAKLLALAPEQRPSNPVLKRLTGPLSRAEGKLSAAQRDFVDSICAILDEDDAKEFRDRFLLAAYGLLSGDPYDYTELVSSATEIRGSLDQEVVDVLALDQLGFRASHERLLSAIDAALVRLVETNTRSAERESRMQAEFDRWVSDRKRGSDYVVGLLRASIADDAQSAKFEKLVGKWMLQCEERVTLQRDEPLLSGIMGPELAPP